MACAAMDQGKHRIVRRWVPSRDSIDMGTRLSSQEILITYKSKAILQVRISSIKYLDYNKCQIEIPYALPPKRFTNPEPLPPNHRYEEKEYIMENSCRVALTLSMINVITISLRCRSAKL